MNEDALYLTDSYLTNFEANVTAIKNNGLDIFLNKTVFYPGGGGQPADEGLLIYNKSPYKVVFVGQDSNRKIFHRLEKPIDIKIGTTIRGEINWNERFILMRYHTALHILCGLIWKEFGAVVTGGKIYRDYARMDFNLEDFSKERIDYIEKRLVEEIEAAHEVRIKTLPREEAFKIPDLIRTKINLLPPEITKIRIVEIVGLDLQADGGTHVRNTSEVGKVNIIETINKGKENKRIIIAIKD